MGAWLPPAEECIPQTSSVIIDCKRDYLFYLCPICDHYGFLSNPGIRLSYATASIIV